MLESSTYKESVANGELVPQITLNDLADPNEEWTTLEFGQIMYKAGVQLFNMGDTAAVSTIFFDWNMN